MFKGELLNDNWLVIDRSGYPLDYEFQLKNDSFIVQFLLLINN